MKDILNIPFKGTVSYTVYENGVAIATETSNLVVDEHKNIILGLLSNQDDGKRIKKVAFGTDSVTPTSSDDLTSFTDIYIKGLSSTVSTENNPYKITFNWTVELYEFVGKTLRSIGLVSDDETTLFSKTLFTTPVTKESDIWLSGTWEIEF